MAAPTLEHADAVMEEISTLFEVNRMGDTEDFLGLQIVGDYGKVNPVNTPWPS
ncbi:hypothetical protein FocTR4_00017168 [Fusarium oxysporum f. sp. cubense]|uniref:Uncharacterized protein n=1 Tax=Fusarium oxysporum f. sp. cubense TaxID=61366 RepID=A0A5C6SJ34_FUSOC|nr:hypothetical protein FocTR4_00017168 [Fusarium oxysporum f. sp. cubense]